MNTPSCFRVVGTAIALLLPLLLLTGCEAVPRTGPGSPYFKVPVGSTLTLNQPVIIPAHSRGVYIQGGQVIENKQLNPVNEYYVYCRLEVKDVRDTPQSIARDMFRVHRVGSRREDVSLASPLYASRGGMGMGFGISGDEDAGPGMENWSVDLYLHSDRQPQVWRLACQHWVYGYEAEFPTVNEIRKTLGGVMSLKLAQ